MCAVARLGAAHPYVETELREREMACHNPNTDADSVLTKAWGVPYDAYARSEMGDYERIPIGKALRLALVVLGCSFIACGLLVWGWVS